MNAPLFRETLLTALEFMPRHRARTKRGATLTLDSFLEEGRWLKDLSPSALDLVLMGHRYAHLFRDELRAFHDGTLKPALLEDLLQVLFAALLSRDRTGPHVLVNEGVEASKKAFGLQTASFVNAFLRSTLRKLPELQARIEAHPESLIGGKLAERWQSEPDLLRTLGAAVVERPPAGISSFDAEGRFERRSIGDFREGKLLQAMDVGSWMLMRWVVGSLSSGSAEGIPPPPGSSGTARRRAKSAGGESLSTLKVTLAPESAPAVPSTKLRILDACAAPGGKTLAFWTLAQKAGLHPQLLAVEANARRLNLLRNNLKRWKLENDIASFLHTWGATPAPESNESSSSSSASQDGALAPELAVPFDLILADLPCTGSGTLHTRPDLLEVDIGERLDSLAPLQEKILLDLQTRLTPNSTLIVSICSVDPEEIANIGRVLGGREPDFQSWTAVSDALQSGDTSLPQDTPLPEGIVAWRIHFQR